MDVDHPGGARRKEIPVLEGIPPSPTAFLPLVTKKQPSEVLESTLIMNRGVLVFWKPCWAQTELRVVASCFCEASPVIRAVLGSPKLGKAAGGLSFSFAKGGSHQVMYMHQF